jgi:hypothetical protein
MNHDERLNLIQKALDHWLTVEPIEDTFNVRLGQGPTARRANIDPLPLLSLLSSTPAQASRQIAGFASGVHHALLEPTRSRGASMSFVECAGSLLPFIAVDTFGVGVESATGSPPWTRPFAKDLRLFFVIRLDRGLRILTEEQADRWGVTPDRITAAARSLLFHRTRELVRTPLPEKDAVFRIRAGDGHDASRCLVVADVFYTEIGSTFRFAIPDPDHLLFVYGNGPGELDVLRRTTEEVYARASIPLSDEIFRFDGSRPRPIEETT